MITFEEPKTFTREDALEAAKKYGNVAHIYVICLARDACWNEWHTADSMTDRNRAQLGYKIMDHVMTTELDSAYQHMLGCK